MPTEFDGSGDWQRVADELRAQRDHQRRTWGDIDDATLGRYLAGESDHLEQRRIEHALEELPELRALADVVRDVLGEPAAKPVLRLRRPPVWYRNPRFALAAAAACLLIVLGARVLPQLGKAETQRVEANFFAARSSAESDPAKLDLHVDHSLESALAQLVEVDREVNEFEKQGNFTFALARAEQYPAIAKDTKLEQSPEYAARLDHLAKLYQQEGQLDSAAPALETAHQICAKNLGPAHPETVRTLVSLADVYQTALNSADAPVAREAKVPALVDAKSTRCALRERLVNQSCDTLKQSVVPVLAEALKHTDSARDRKRLVKALAHLGPAAKDVSPVLSQMLRDAGSEEERQCVAQAISSIWVPEAKKRSRDKDVLIGISAGPIPTMLGD